MNPLIARSLLDKAEDGIGLRQAIRDGGLDEKEALLYMRKHHREDYKTAKAQGAPKALKRFLAAREKARS